MDTLEFISSLVHSLAWPSAAVGGVFLLRDPFSHAISRRLKEASGFGMNFKFGTEELQKALDDAEEIAEAAPEPAREESAASATPAPGDPLTDWQRLRRLAQDEPRGAIILGYIEVEDAVNELAKSVGIDPRPGRAAPVLSRLTKEDAIPNGLLGLIMELRLIRNQAVHNKTFDISTSEAVDYLGLCDKAATWATFVTLEPLKPHG